MTGYEQQKQHPGSLTIGYYTHYINHLNHHCWLKSIELAETTSRFYFPTFHHFSAALRQEAEKLRQEIIRSKRLEAQRRDQAKAEEERIAREAEEKQEAEDAALARLQAMEEAGETAEKAKEKPLVSDPETFSADLAMYRAKTKKTKKVRFLVVAQYQCIILSLYRLVYVVSKQPTSRAIIHPFPITNWLLRILFFSRDRLGFSLPSAYRSCSWQVTVRLINYSRPASRVLICLPIWVLIYMIFVYR